MMKTKALCFSCVALLCAFTLNTVLARQKTDTTAWLAKVRAQQAQQRQIYAKKTAEAQKRVAQQKEAIGSLRESAAHIAALREKPPAAVVEGRGGETSATTVPVTTPTVTQAPAQQLPMCRDCYDSNDAYNYKDNFIYDKQGRRIQRLHPLCNCPMRVQSVTNVPSATTTPTTGVGGTSETQSGWHIHY